MTLYLLRHASAGESKSDPQKDAKRPLDRTGVAQAVRMGRLLAALGVQLDAIHTSPLKRTAQTASLVANELGFEDKLITETALAPGATPAAYQQLIADNRQREAILVVGHNPSISQALGRIVGGAQHPLRMDMPKGSLARVDVDRAGAQLVWMITPKLVKAAES